MGWRKRPGVTMLCAALTLVAPGLSFRVYLLLTGGLCTFYLKKKKSNLCIFYIIYKQIFV